MAEPEWDQLELIVGALVAAGNRRRTEFRPSQGGWWCSMERPLDPDAVLLLTGADARLNYDERADELSCRHCWASIFGANHE